MRSEICAQEYLPKKYIAQKDLQFSKKVRGLGKIYYV